MADQGVMDLFETGDSFAGFDGVEPEIDTSDDRITEPFDPTKIRVETKQQSLDTILSRIERQEIDLSPAFQRHAGIWKDDVQSRLIESLLIMIPLPAFYVDATDEDRWVVVDGLQRLTALKRFVLDKSNNLRLSGLEFLTDMLGKSFDELPRTFQRRIKETQTTVYLIAKGTPDEVKFNIFKRINTGGLPLTLQEIRHALNQGAVTVLLKELATSEEFKRATDNGVSPLRMADREMVLRFFAFRLNDYRMFRHQNFDVFLHQVMKHINSMNERDRKNIERQFKRAMLAATSIFEKDAFRKRYRIDASRNQINKALFESWSVNLHNLTDKQIELLTERREQLKQKYIDLMNNDTMFDKSISQGTGDVAKVNKRFSTIEQLISEVLQ